MKKIKSLVFALMLILTANVFAQTTVRGTIVDANSGETLIGASAAIEGTTTGVTTDVDGKFEFQIPNGSQNLIFTYIGYSNVSKKVNAKGKTIELGKIELTEDAFGLDEISVVASIAVDRKTPVAVSTIKPQMIAEKLGTQEFPEILKSTPGVYVTKSGGGYGDSRINLRGFDSRNVAVMVNGVPINDMESGKVYWSNWAGMSDATRTMQVQRGLGASKVAVPSVGGTINILTKTSESKRGGEISTYYGNDAYKKEALTLSTGNVDGWASTISLSKTEGDGYVDATDFKAYSYFFSLSKRLNDAHLLSFVITGAPQWHNQRKYEINYEDYQKSPRGIRYNDSWGYNNGQLLNLSRNFYHKPQAFLTHFWTVSPELSISNVAYASVGTGGGTGTAFNNGNNKFLDKTYRRDGKIDFDKIVNENIANANQGSDNILRASMNNHKWYGLLSSVKYDLNNITFTSGIDARYYKGEHYQVANNLLGGAFYKDTKDKNEPVKIVREGDKMAYNNDGHVMWSGLFGTAEYSSDNLSSFMSLAASSKSYKRVDHFNYLDSDDLQETDWSSFLGYSAKTGANYNINDNHNAFVNVGYFERQPEFRAVYLNYRNDINEDAENEKIASFELGYGFKSDFLTVKVNAYHTRWMDKTLTKTFRGQAGDYIANILGIDAIHQGVELELFANPTEKLNITAMASVGDWRWGNDIKDVKIFDDKQVEIDKVDLYIEDAHVGDAAQTTFALGVNYEFMKGLKFGVDYNYYADLYAEFDVTKRDKPSSAGDSEKLADYGVFRTNMKYDFEIAGLNSTMYANIDNLLDDEFITEKKNGNTFVGLGRTWSIGLKVRF